MKKIGQMNFKKSADFGLDSHASIGFECLDRELFDPERCYDLLSETGVKYARVQTGWNRTEKVKGVLSFDWLDDIVDNLLKRGIQPWFNVTFGNKVYMPDANSESAVGYVPILYGEEVMKAWLHFTEKLAEHFKDRVSVYEIWNEPDISAFWAPEKSNPFQYAQLVRQTGDVILSVNKDAKIGACMACALYSHGDTESFDFLSDFAANVGKLDFFSFHRYLSRPDVDFALDISMIRKLFAKGGNPDITVLGGECGYGSYLPDGHCIVPIGHSSERQQATTLLRYFVNDAKQGIRFTSFFQTVDMIQKLYHTASYSKKDVARSGILNGIVYTPKKSYYALRTISHLFGEDFSVGDRYISLVTYPFEPYVHNPLQPWTASFERKGKPFYCYYYPAFIEDEVENLPNLPVLIQNIESSDEICDPIAVDGMTGEVFEPDSIRDFHAVRMLEGMPVSDHPIFIFDRKDIDFTECAE